MSAWAPELQVFVIVAAILLFSYFVIYPLLKPQTMQRMAVYDFVLLLITLLIIGLRFGGTDTVFSMRVIGTNWLVFTVIIAMVLEAPLFLWYVRKHGMDKP